MCRKKSDDYSIFGTCEGKRCRKKWRFFEYIQHLGLEREQVSKTKSDHYSKRCRNDSDDCSILDLRGKLCRVVFDDYSISGRERENNTSKRKCRLQRWPHEAAMTGCWGRGCVPREQRKDMCVRHARSMTFTCTAVSHASY